MSQDISSTIPIPEDPINDVSDDCRIWIGNMDTRLTEYSLLKVLKKFGSLKRFDFIYHKSGVDKGKSKGYCFVSYEKREDAKKALSLNGKMALSKKLIVKWAHNEKQPDNVKTGTTTVSASNKDTDTISPESKIRQIEAKLRKMEESQEDFTMSFKPSAPPGSSSLSSANLKLTAKHTSQNSQKHQKKPYRR